MSSQGMQPVSDVTFALTLTFDLGSLKADIRAIMPGINYRYLYLLLTYIHLLVRRRKRIAERESPKRRRQPKFWVRPSLQKREEHGVFHTLLKEYRENDREYFFRYCRMSPESFDYLAYMVESRIKKKRTNFRKPISPEERLALTLHYLASGETQQFIAGYFRIGRQTVGKILRETCTAIWEVLGPIYLKQPSSQDEWKKIESDFQDLWNFPHVIGAIDGKHIRIEKPKNTGSLHYNYKSYFSSVLLAACDAKYCFTLVDIGQYGSGNDSGVLNESHITNSMEENTLNIPEAEPIEGITGKIPYFLVGDEIFGLKKWLMRPYPAPLDEPKRIFNYRLSRARRTIENTFGLLVARWRVFRQPICANIQTVDLIIQATCCLHNFLQTTNSAAYSPSGFMDSEQANGEIVEGDWRKIVKPHDGGAFAVPKKAKGGRKALQAVEIQNKLKDYVNSSGSVDWQLDYVRRTETK